MASHARHLVSILVIAITAALLLTALPVSIATAAAGPKACKVYNLDGKFGRNTLQRAVWSADPGDRLVVRGTCVGTTIIRKDLTIRPLKRAGSGAPILRSGSRLPTLVVDSSVDGLVIKPGLRIQGTVVVDDVRSWKRRTAATAYEPTPAASVPARACNVQNLGSGATFGRMQQAVDAAAPGDRLVFTGKCWGGTTIDKSVRIKGLRIRASSVECGPAGCRTPEVSDTGVPVITDLTVESGVKGVRLSSLTLPQGFAVR